MSQLPRQRRGLVAAIGVGLAATGLVALFLVRGSRMARDETCPYNHSAARRFEAYRGAPASPPHPRVPQPQIVGASRPEGLPERPPSQVPGSVWKNVTRMKQRGNAEE